MAYVQENDAEFEQYASYIKDNKIMFTQRAVSENLRTGLTTILQSACSDFLHELIFQTRDINFQNKQKINSFLEELESTKQGEKAKEVSVIE